MSIYACSGFEALDLLDGEEVFQRIELLNFFVSNKQATLYRGDETQPVHASEELYSAIETLDPDIRINTVIVAFFDREALKNGGFKTSLTNIARLTPAIEEKVRTHACFIENQKPGISDIAARDWF